jgi:hypothetical protein
MWKLVFVPQLLLLLLLLSPEDSENPETQFFFYP